MGDLAVGILNRLDEAADTLWSDGDEAKAKLMDDAQIVIQTQAAEIKRLREILARHVDGEQPCWHDHHGYCQAHYLEEDCRVAAARAALGETE
jgi:hypothetical protein